MIHPRKPPVVTLHSMLGQTFTSEELVLLFIHSILQNGTCDQWHFGLAWQLQFKPCTACLRNWEMKNCDLKIIVWQFCVGVAIIAGATGQLPCSCNESCTKPSVCLSLNTPWSNVFRVFVTTMGSVQMENPSLLLRMGYLFCKYGYLCVFRNEDALADRSLTSEEYQSFTSASSGQITSPELQELLSRVDRLLDGMDTDKENAYELLKAQENKVFLVDKLTQLLIH